MLREDIYASAQERAVFDSPKVLVDTGLVTMRGEGFRYLNRSCAVSFVHTMPVL